MTLAVITEANTCRNAVMPAMAGIQNYGSDCRIKFRMMLFMKVRAGVIERRD